MAQPKLPMVWLDLFWMVNAAWQLDSPTSIFVTTVQVNLIFIFTALFSLSCLAQLLIRSANALNITIFLKLFFIMVILIKIACK